MVSLRAVSPTEKPTLWNFLQKYLYEMSQFYSDEMDTGGSYSYPHFGRYFSDENRHAYFIEHSVEDDERIVGFAMVNAHSCLGRPIDHAMAEFTVFPVYRKRGLAAEAVKQVFALHPGAWEIKYSLVNIKASRFWRTVTAGFYPHYEVAGDEAVLSFTVIDG